MANPISSKTKTLHLNFYFFVQYLFVNFLFDDSFLFYLKKGKNVHLMRSKSENLDFKGFKRKSLTYEYSFRN